jgi:hypothetical protein
MVEQDGNEMIVGLPLDCDITSISTGSTVIVDNIVEC